MCDEMQDDEVAVSIMSDADVVDLLADLGVAYPYDNGGPADRETLLILMADNRRIHDEIVYGG